MSKYVKYDIPQVGANTTIKNFTALGARAVNKKIEGAVNSLHKKYNLSFNDFTRIDIKAYGKSFEDKVDLDFNATDLIKSLEISDPKTKKAWKDSWKGTDFQKTIDEVEFISKQLDNAPDKKVIQDERKLRTITTGTVEGVPVYRYQVINPKHDSLSPALDSIFMPNETGLEKLAKLKNNITKRDVLTGLRDRNNKGGLVNRLQQRNMYG